MSDTPEAPAPGWLLHWKAASRAQEAAACLARHGLVVVLAGREASGLPPPLDEEREAAARVRDPQGFMVRRALARAVAGAACAVPPEALGLQPDAAGAPRLAGADLFVSFSARDARGAIALARQPVGVDLELALPPAGMPWQVLRQDERAALEALDAPAREQAFLSLWRAKEAVLKAAGCGFARPPEAVQVEGATAWLAPGSTCFRLLQAPEAGISVALAALAAQRDCQTPIRTP